MADTYTYYTLGDYYDTTEEVVSNDTLFVGISGSDLLSFKDKWNTTNLERIFNQYTPNKKEEYRAAFEVQLVNIATGQQVTWKEKFIPGTVIFLPKDKINRAVAARDGGRNQVIGSDSKNRNTNTLSYLSDEVDKIINDDTYQQTVITESTRDGSTVTQAVPNARVKIWSRAMSYIEGQPKKNKETELLGRWIDVSRYVQVMQTHTDKMGGNFSFTLVPVMSEYSEASSTWESDRSTISNAGDDMIAQSTVFTKNKSGDLKRGNYIFNMALQENDIVYIAFEPLDNEIDEERSFIQDGISEAAGDNTAPWGFGLYDMIGLIDSVSQSFSPGDNDITIDVQGRDLSKLLIEDGSYMYSNLWEGHNFFLEKEDGLLKRSFGPGGRQAYNFYAEPRYRSVQEAVLFIINVLSNITVCPDETTNGNSEGSVITTTSKNDATSEFITQSGNGIWRSVKLGFDENIKERRLVDTGLGTPDGSLLDLIFNYAQEPWIETIMDTYNKHWHLIFRMPPFDKKRVKEFIDIGYFTNVFVDNKDVLNESLDWETEVYSLYQLDYKAATGGKETVFSVIPTVPLPDYAEMYGTRRWKGSSNMIPVSLVDDANGPDNAAYVRSQGINDLTWVIETHAYLPFTRRGTISINGDRRFKKNTWFHYKPTNEIFYITGVTHNFNGGGPIDRTTILTVTRGMVLDYVTGEETVPGTGEELSYFNIISIEKLNNFLKNQLKVNDSTDGTSKNSQGSTATNFRVNREVFNFFRTRSQFKDK